MQVLARRLFRRLEGIEFSFCTRQELVLEGRARRRHLPLPSGHGAKALAARLKARRERFDVVVFMLDADTGDVKEWKRKRQEVVDGFARIDDEIIALVCLPMATSETWLLADAGAWKSLSRDHEAPLHELERISERTWGERDHPDGDHPHQIFARVCARVGLSDSRETRVAVAEQTDLAKLEKRCPTSFGGLLEDLRPFVSGDRRGRNSSEGFR